MIQCIYAITAIRKGDTHTGQVAMNEFNSGQILTITFSIVPTHNDVSSSPASHPNVSQNVDRIYALNALLRSLAPLIGAEEELGQAVKSGWASGASSEKLDEWRSRGLELEAELRSEIESVFEEEHWKLYRTVCFQHLT